MPKPSWLVGLKKRAVKDEPVFLDSGFFDELYETVTMTGWPYKINREMCQLRDRALMSLLVLTGCRISEVLLLKRLQFRNYQDRIVVKNVETVKNGNTRDTIILPKLGNLARFTQIFEDWLQNVPSRDSFIFPCASTGKAGFHWEKPLSRQRAFWIIKTSTKGKFPHWFRSVCETIYGRIVFQSDAWKLKQFMGLRRLDSTSAYVRGSWEKDKDRIFLV